MIPKNILKKLYQKGLSLSDIAKDLKVSVHAVSYWMDKYGLQRRSISDALYRKCNPHGDPFRIKKSLTGYEKFLKGMGIGLFWGEGTKLQKYAVRLGNTDPFLILYFRDFLEKICGVSREKIKYSLQIFGDIDKEEAIKFWSDILSIRPKQLGNPSMVQLRGKGTYRKKNKFGVLQIACHNTKLKNIVDEMLRSLKDSYLPTPM